MSQEGPRWLSGETRGTRSATRSRNTSSRCSRFRQPPPRQPPAQGPGREPRLGTRRAGWTRRVGMGGPRVNTWNTVLRLRSRNTSSRFDVWTTHHRPPPRPRGQAGEPRLGTQRVDWTRQESQGWTRVKHVEHGSATPEQKHEFPVRPFSDNSPQTTTQAQGPGRRAQVGDPEGRLDQEGCQGRFQGETRGTRFCDAGAETRVPGFDRSGNHHQPPPQAQGPRQESRVEGP